MSENERIYPRAMPILPIFHGSGAMAIDETVIHGLPYIVEISELGLRKATDVSQTIQVIYATSDPLLALGYTLRHRLPDADKVFSIRRDDSGLFDVHVIFFTLMNEQGEDVTYEEWGNPLVLFDVEPQEGRTFVRCSPVLNSGSRKSINLASEWVIAGETNVKAIAAFTSIHEIAAAGIQIYTMDGRHIDMWRRPVSSRREGWDESAIPFDLWAKMMGRYTHPFDKDKMIKLWDQFEDLSQMLESGILTHLNPQLQGPLPEDSHVPKILEIRERLNQLFQGIYSPKPE